MTTTPVMPITDEQIAEIERDIAMQAAIKPGQCEGGVMVRGDICSECGATARDSCRRPLPKSYAIPSNVASLISRLRAAERDAGRYRFIRDTDELPMNLMRLDMMGDLLDAEIDAAMEQAK